MKLRYFYFIYSLNKIDKAYFIYNTVTLPEFNFSHHMLYFNNLEYNINKYFKDKINLNHASIHSLSPFCWAVYRNNYKLVEMMLDSNEILASNVNANSANSTRSSFMKKHINKHIYSSFCDAAYINNHKILYKMFNHPKVSDANINNSIDINIKYLCKFRSSMYWIFYNKNINMIKVMLFSKTRKLDKTQVLTDFHMLTHLYSSYHQYDLINNNKDIYINNLVERYKKEC